MRRILAYENGRPIWSENVESYARLSTIGGSISVSAPGPNDASVHANQKAVSRKAEKAA